MVEIEVNEKEIERIQALALRIQLAESVLSYIDTNYPEETQNNETYKRVRDRYERMIEMTKKKSGNRRRAETEGWFISSTLSANAG